MRRSMSTVRRASFVRSASQTTNEIDWMELRKRMVRKSATNPLFRLSPGAREIVMNWITDQHLRRQKQQEMTKTDIVMRRKNMQVFLLAAFGVLLMVMDEESKWTYGDQYQYGLDNVSLRKSYSVFDVLIPLSSFVLVWRLADLYMLLSEKKRQRWKLQSRWDAFKHSSLRKKFFLEAAVCLVQPAPWIVYHYEFMGDSWVRHMGLFMLARVYHIARVFKDFSAVYRARHQAHRAGQISHYSMGFMVTLRAELNERPLAVVVTTLSFTVAIFAYVIYVIERQSRFEGNEPNIDTFVKAFWFVIVTLTTVGYGDTFPSTAKGYYPAMLEGFVAMILTSMLITVVIEKLTMRGDERDMFQWVESRQQTRVLRKAARALVCAWLEHVAWRRRQRKKLLQRMPAMNALGLVPSPRMRSPTSAADFADADGDNKIPIELSAYFVAVKPYLKRFRMERAKLKTLQADFGRASGAESVGSLLRKLAGKQRECDEQLARTEKSANRLLGGQQGPQM